MANKTHGTPPVDPDEDDGDTLQAQVSALQEQVQALLKLQSSGGGITDDRLEKILLKVADATAEAAERAANPSNKTHPGISVFSYPEGDREHPRSLKCPMFWCGYDVATDTSTAEELELMNQAKPGVYQFKRTDHTPQHPSYGTLTVTGTTDAAGDISRLDFSFPIEEQLETVPSITVMLQTAFHVKSAQERELDAMRQELEAMRAKLSEVSA